MKKLFYLLPFLLGAFPGAHALSLNQMSHLHSFMDDFCRLPEKIRNNMVSHYWWSRVDNEQLYMNLLSYQTAKFQDFTADENEVKALENVYPGFYESYQEARAQLMDDLKASEAGFKILGNPELKKLIVDAIKTVAEKYNDKLDGQLMVEAVRAELHGLPAFKQIMQELENGSEFLSKECKSFFTIDTGALEKEFFNQLEAKCAQ